MFGAGSDQSSVVGESKRGGKPAPAVEGLNDASIEGLP